MESIYIYTRVGFANTAQPHWGFHAKNWEEREVPTAPVSHHKSLVEKRTIRTLAN